MILPIVATIRSGHYGALKGDQKRRHWSTLGVSGAQVARRYAMNANLIFTWPCLKWASSGDEVLDVLVATDASIFARKPGIHIGCNQTLLPPPSRVQSREETPPIARRAFPIFIA